MGRRWSRARRQPAGGGHAPVDSLEEWAGAQYAVRAVTGSKATKAYRCPGCDQEIRLATPHLVAWPAGDQDAGDRRHWHTACWRARDRRAPSVLRSRNAPRHG